MIFLKLLEICLTCMKLQLPPRLHVPSSSCLHLATRKSCTGEYSGLIITSEQYRPLILLQHSSASYSLANLTQTLPTRWGLRFAQTTMSSTSPCRQSSLKISSQNYSKRLTARSMSESLTALWLARAESIGLFEKRCGIRVGDILGKMCLRWHLSMYLQAPILKQKGQLALSRSEAITRTSPSAIITNQVNFRLRLGLRLSPMPIEFSPGTVKSTRVSSSSLKRHIQLHSSLMGASMRLLLRTRGSSVLTSVCLEYDFQGLYMWLLSYYCLSSLTQDSSILLTTSFCMQGRQRLAYPCSLLSNLVIALARGMLLLSPNVSWRYLYINSVSQAHPLSSRQQLQILQPALPLTMTDCYYTDSATHALPAVRQLREPVKWPFSYEPSQVDPDPRPATRQPMPEQNVLMPSPCTTIWANQLTYPFLARRLKTASLDLPMALYQNDPALAAHRQRVLTFFRRKALVELGDNHSQHIPAVLFKAAQILDCYLLEKKKCDEREQVCLLSLASKTIIKRDVTLRQMSPSQMHEQNLDQAELEVLSLVNGEGKFVLAMQLMHNSFYDYLPWQQQYVFDRTRVSIQSARNVSMILWHLFESNHLPFPNFIAAPALMLCLIARSATCENNFADLDIDLLKKTLAATYAEDFGRVEHAVGVLGSIQ